MASFRRVTLVSLLAVCAAVACAPKLQPLAGAPVPARLPLAQLAPGHRKTVFHWEIQDGELSARGDGVARVAAPDSVRLDLFLAGGFGGGAAVLVGDSLAAPGGDMVRRFVPPPPMLWASLGRLAVPALPDTVVRVDGGFLRADIGRPTAWRLTFRGDTLVRAEHVEGGRIVEWVDRSGDRVVYRHESPRRTLTLTGLRAEEGGEFDAAIWRLD